MMLLNLQHWSKSVLSPWWKELILKFATNFSWLKFPRVSQSVIIIFKLEMAAITPLGQKSGMPAGRTAHLTAITPLVEKRDRCYSHPFSAYQ